MQAHGPGNFPRLNSRLDALFLSGLICGRRGKSNHLSRLDGAAVLQRREAAQPRPSVVASPVTDCVCPICTPPRAGVSERVKWPSARVCLAVSCCSMLIGARMEREVKGSTHSRSKNVRIRWLLGRRSGGSSNVLRQVAVGEGPVFGDSRTGDLDGRTEGSRPCRR